MITYNVNTTQGQTEKWVIVLIKCKEGTRVNMNFGHNINRQNKSNTSETSCQTEEELAGEIKPSMVSVETQWDRDDFLPSLELVQRDHTYSNTKRVSKKKRSWRIFLLIALPPCRGLNNYYHEWLPMVAVPEKEAVRGEPKHSSLLGGQTDGSKSSYGHLQ